MTEPIRGAVIHLVSEQPLVADLLAMPTARDTLLVCTNLRTTGGKRPAFVDRIDSIFYFPLVLVRFIEIAPGAIAPALPAGEAGADAEVPGTEGDPDADIEIDEDFLRRIREA